MNIQDKLAKLAEVGEPVPVVSHYLTQKFITGNDFGGWISVEDKGDHWFVLWTNKQNSHNRAGGAKCCAADFRKDTGMPFILDNEWTGAWESAISLWNVHKKDQEKADKIFEFIRSCLDEAHVAYMLRRTA
jgi:hypothetical protein